MIELGLAAEVGVARHDFAAHRAVDVGGRLDGLDDRAGLAGGDATAGLGRLDEHEVAERLLGVVGDADRDGAVGLEARPLVGLEEAQVGGNVAHGRAPWKRDVP